jgi:carboxymethylenebutenolidase
MCDDDIHQGQARAPDTLSRRTFGGLTAAAAVSVATGAYAADMVTKDVEVKTADGVADAALFHPAGKGTWPAVLVWPDIGGLRPVFRDLGRRLAGQGYVVLVVNPFYRSARAPVVGDTFDFANPDHRQKLMALHGAMTDAGTDRDAAAFLKFLDAQPQTNRRRKAGVQGYCMGGPLSFRTAAAVPGRIGAVASFHGGGLTTDQANSPHLLIPKTKASYLVAVAENDDKKDPASKEILRKALAAAGRPAAVEVYPANHGWCVKGGPAYDEVQAERAWTALTRLYKTALA